MSDFNKASELFQEIGKALHSNLEGEWKIAKIVFDLDPDPEGKLSAMKDGETTSFSDDVVTSLKANLKTLRELTKKEGQNPWKKANFSITKEGKFDLNFEY